MKRIILLFATLLAAGVRAQTDSLDRYLEQAARNNPGVQAAFTLWRAGVEKVSAAGARQDPQLDVGLFLQPMALAEGRQIAEFRLMQMFPWFGTRKAARTEAQQMARMAYEQFRETRDRLLFDLREQYFTLCRLQRQSEAARENRELLGRLERLALRRFSSPTGGGSTPEIAPAATAASPVVSGGGMGGMSMGAKRSPTPPATASQGVMPSMDGSASGMADVLRIRIEMAEAENDEQNLLSEIAAAKGRFNALLGRPAESGIALPDTLAVTALPFDWATSRELVERQNPMLAMIARQNEAYGAKADMERRMSYPMFGVGLQYMLVGKREMVMGGMNGRDMTMPMVSVTLPVFRGKYRVQQRENALLQQAGREQYADMLNMLEAELARARSEWDNACRRVDLLRRQTVLAEAACSLATQEFASGRGDLDGVVATQRRLLDYRTRTAEAIAACNTMAATIIKLVSTEEDYE